MSDKIRGIDDCLRPLMKEIAEINHEYALNVESAIFRLGISFEMFKRRFIILKIKKMLIFMMGVKETEDFYSQVWEEAFRQTACYVDQYVIERLWQRYNIEMQKQ